MGKITINEPFSIAMLNYQRVDIGAMRICLVLTGTMELEMTFPFSWEWNNHPN